MVALSKFALEGFSKSVNKELVPEWNIKVMIVAPSGVNTQFFTNEKLSDRLPVYADSPSSPLNGLLNFMKGINIQERCLAPEKCAAVVFDVVVGQNEHPLPERLCLGKDALTLIRKEFDHAFKELNDWEDVSLKVTPGGK
jgi:hypothetical protein